ncbi:unnamed protein product [Vitrella brassicaformis CCMP3155]|uniref:Uncharacterized protein n=1 Tax=Vitrella brassicaformis (strain CCMP3155) TaxID=1169540 RepID=A0A0G4E8X4_VITBC|nr:unnamed protein product [Vitrella brassicaformis CCMP3155]|eukprot:CEL91647.1 unnamed protein product [Vitrella brassicaformis CCMP3155]
MIIGRLIQQHLSRFFTVEDIDRQLSIASLTDPDIELTDVPLKGAILDLLDLPLDLVRGKADWVRVRFAWKTLFDSTGPSVAKQRQQDNGEESAARTDEQPFLLVEARRMHIVARLRDPSTWDAAAVREKHENSKTRLLTAWYNFLRSWRGPDRGGAVRLGGGEAFSFSERIQRKAIGVMKVRAEEFCFDLIADCLPPHSFGIRVNCSVLHVGPPSGDEDEIEMDEREQQGLKRLLFDGKVVRFERASFAYIPPPQDERDATGREESTAEGEIGQAKVGAEDETESLLRGPRQQFLEDSNLLIEVRRWHLSAPLSFNLSDLPLFLLAITVTAFPSVTQQEQSEKPLLILALPDHILNALWTIYQFLDLWWTFAKGLRLPTGIDPRTQEAARYVDLWIEAAGRRHTHGAVVAAATAPFVSAARQELQEMERHFAGTSLIHLQKEAHRKLQREMEENIRPSIWGSVCCQAGQHHARASLHPSSDLNKASIDERLDETSSDPSDEGRHGEGEAQPETRALHWFGLDQTIKV